MKELERREKTTDGIHYEGISYELTGGHYTVEVYYKDGKPNGIDIKENWEERDELYLQEIYLHNIIPASNSEEWKKELKIQTTSYASKSIAEIDKVIEGYRIAQEACREIEENFKEFF